MEENPEAIDPYVAALEAQCARMDREAQVGQAQRWGRVVGISLAAMAVYFVARKVFSRQNNGD